MKKILLTIVAVIFTAFSYAQDYLPTVQTGVKAPEFTLSDTLGVKHSLKDFRGKYVVIDFWASWCGDCRREMPELIKLYNDFKDITIDGKQIEWLGVSFDQDKAAWKKYLTSAACPWLQVCGLKKMKDSPVSKQYGISWIPSLVVVDDNGVVCAKAITAEGLNRELCRLVGIKLLPAPSATRGSDIMTTLKNRRTDRDYEDREISEQDLSDLLWAAGGVNREDGKLTSPTAMNRQEITLYAIDANGAYLYEPAKHSLKLIAEGDHRNAVAGFQKNFAEVPLFILMVCDFDKFGNKNNHAQKMVCVDAGIVSENISVFCAAVGMKTCARATMDVKALQELLGLNENQVPMMNNSIGY